MTSDHRRETVRHCPVCGSGSHSKLFVSGDWLYRVEGEFPLIRCDECGLVYLKERPDAHSLRLYYPADTYYAYQAPTRHSLFSRAGAVAPIWYLIKRSILAADYNYGHL